MTLVTRTMKATGNYVYAQCWVLYQGQHIVLTPKGVDLPAGRYELQWEFRGDPTSSITFTVSALDVDTNQACTTGTHVLAHGQTHVGSGSDKPAGYVAKIFQV